MSVLKWIPSLATIKQFAKKYWFLEVFALFGIGFNSFQSHPLAMFSLTALAFAQNISFSIVSRSRNRDNITYHFVAAIFSNGVWYLTFKALIAAGMNLILFVPYTLGTVLGSISGQKISMYIESILGASSDSHLAPKV